MHIKTIIMITNKTIAALLNNSTQTAQNVRKNITDFEPFGVTIADMDALDAKIEALYSHRPDSHYMNLLLNSTARLTENRALLLKTFKTVTIQLKWWVSRKLVTPNDLKTVTLSDKNQATLLLKASNLLKLVNENENYASFLGANKALITEFATYLSAVKSEMDLKNTLKGEREKETELRVKLLSEIREQVALLCATGKNLYRGVSQAQYDQFLTYSTKSNRLTETPQEGELSDVA